MFLLPASPLTGPLVEIPPTPVVEYEPVIVTALGLLNTYALVFVAAFAVTLLATPIVRRVAVSAGVIDHPDDPRKAHDFPVAYLGGIAVFLGVMTAIAVSYLMTDQPVDHMPLPIAIVIGMVAVTFTGLADDVWGWDPRLKIAGQLVAAAALAISDVGVHVAEGLLSPLMGGPMDVLVSIGSMEILNGQLFYWVGTALIAIFVLGGCNAANFLDGLDGLLSGVVAIAAVGLLAISILMANRATDATSLFAEDPLVGARIVLCLALLGAVLGFLPHNFNPATIFLGDCGSLLLGYLCVTIILMMGEMGYTHLVAAGLIVFALPIIDTTLAIFRRMMAGISMSAADDQHVHHQLKRAFKSVKRAVFALYGIAAVFAMTGVTLAALVMYTELRIRMVYALAAVFFSYVGVIAVKSGRRQKYRIESHVATARAAPVASEPSVPATSESPAGAASAKKEPTATPP